MDIRRIRPTWEKSETHLNPELGAWYSSIIPAMQDVYWS
jgi:hypothetical protein